MKQAVFGKPKLLTLSQNEELAGTEEGLNHLRALRKPLMEAFDIYKSNVYYGILSETSEEKAEILAWYQELCDLQLTALENVPEKVKRYLK